MFRRVQTDIQVRLYLFGFFLAVALLIMAADSFELLRPVERVVSVVLSPVTGASRQLGLNLANLSVFTTNLDQLREENRQLRKDLEAAQTDKALLANQATQLEQLRKELDFKSNPQNKRFQTVSADVINVDTTGQNQAIVINKGDNERLTVGMSVVDTSGYLVGRVYRVDADKAIVMLITDSKMAVNATTQRYENNKRVQVAEPADGTAVGQWQIGGRISLVRIKGTADVKPGDWVFTNGLGGTFPPNVLVGYVDKVIAQEGQPDKQAQLRPFAELERLQRVQVITNWRDE